MSNIINSDERKKRKHKNIIVVNDNEDEGNLHDKLENKINELKSKRTKKSIHKKCQHGKDPYICRDCGGKGICKHDKQKHRCKECGGSSICKHDKMKHLCTECNGSSICTHGKNKRYCKDCDGNAFCIHGKQKQRCIDCDGNQICIHKKLKFRCAECDGSQLCSHNKRKECCFDCGGSQMCEHKKLISECKKCGGSKICIHNCNKFRCKDCHGSQVCEHNKIRIDCVKCDGSQICIHKKRKNRCVDCDGSQICIHKKVKTQCAVCDQEKHPENWCKLCKYVIVQQGSYKPYCFNCYCVTFPDAEIKRQFKLKEHHLRDELKKYYDSVILIFDKRVDNGCSLRRPDVRIECFTHTIIIECDENKHQGYSCENKRIMELFQDLGNRPIIFLRFNPDSYTDAKSGNCIAGCFNKTTNINNSIQRKEWNRRILCLKERIDYHLDNIPTKEVTVEHLFYE